MLTELNHNSKAIIEKTKSVRRRRIELRRMKSLCPKTPVCCGDVCLKRRLLNGDDSDRSTSSEESVKQIGEKRGRIEELNLDGGERLKFGSISVIGHRREMEDAVAVEVGFLTRDSKRYDFFGVYDGHGGSRVAEACRHRLQKVVAKRVEEGGQEINWREVMLASFEEMDEEVNKNGAAVATMGSTATVAVVGEEVVVVANCGDSRAVVSRGGVAVPLSTDHKPERADELKRIEVCGGKVINWNGQRVLGVLATSRSIGDNYLKPFVISEPEVTVNVRTENDEFMIIASDGLWDVISNDLACQHTRRLLYGSTGAGGDDGGCASDAAAALAQLAMARGSRDNISVIVVDLNRSKQHSTLQIGQDCC